MGGSSNYCQGSVQFIRIVDSIAILYEPPCKDDQFINFSNTARVVD